MSATDHFSQDTTGLPQSRSTEIVDVAPGGSFGLGIAAVRKRIGDIEVRMLAYIGSEIARAAAQVSQPSAVRAAA